VEELSQPTGRLRVGVARTKWGSVDVEPEVLGALDATAALLEQMGHAVTELQTPDESAEYSKILLNMSDLRETWFEASADAMGRKLSAETLEPVNLKLYEHSRSLPLSLAEDVHEGLRTMRVRVGEAIDAFDIVLTPTMPKVALPHGGIYCATNTTTSPQGYMEADASLYSQLGIFNVTGHPSVSLPAGQGAGGMPIGLQVVGRFGDEATLVRVSRDLEEARPWRGLRPKIHAAVPA
jgi:amidase